MEKLVTIGGREYKMRCSALLPRQYRFKFGSDLIADMSKLAAATKKAAKGQQMESVDLTIFENVAWLMLKAGGEEVGESPEEWLDTLEGLFPVYEALPAIIELWAASNATTSTPKKK